MFYILGYFIFGFIIASIYTFKEKDLDVFEFMLLFILYPFIIITVFLMVWVDFLSKYRRTK